MLRKLFTLLLAFFAAAAFAAVDANKADQAALESIKGIGPAISGKIIDERKKGAFKDWDDMITRVQGIGETNAGKFSAEGLTVNGATFKGAAPAAKKDDKPAAKTEAKAEPKADAKAAKADTKAAKSSDKKAEAAPAAKAASEPAKAEKAAKPEKAEKSDKAAKPAKGSASAASAPAPAAKK